jgi:hypothetical protein
VIKEDVIYLDNISDKVKSSEVDFDIIENELVTLHAIRQLWFGKETEKETIEHITELLFSNKTWIKDEK